MDKSMILELAFSDKSYDDRIKFADNKKLQESYDKFYEICDKLCKDFSKEEKHNIIWDIDLAMGAVVDVYINEYFKAGFKLGLTIAAQNFLE
ncbi:MAG: hypothetical protein K2I29_05520 [Clostridia bacterium]|nr:hypothetical protein [Clostridia bacterium]